MITKHSTTGMKPDGAKHKYNHFEVWLNINSKAAYNRKCHPLEIGSQVRTHVKPKNMKKQNVPVWSKAVFKITFTKDN